MKYNPALKQETSSTRLKHSDTHGTIITVRMVWPMDWLKTSIITKRSQWMKTTLHTTNKDANTSTVLAAFLDPDYTDYWKEARGGSEGLGHAPSDVQGRIHEQGRITANAGPGAVPNVGSLHTYNQLTTPTNCGPLNCGTGCCSTPSTPLMPHCPWELWRRSSQKTGDRRGASFRRTVLLSTGIQVPTLHSILTCI